MLSQTRHYFPGTVILVIKLSPPFKQSNLWEIFVNMLVGDTRYVRNVF
jgi:hypothetical protein